MEEAQDRQLVTANVSRSVCCRYPDVSVGAALCGRPGWERSPIPQNPPTQGGHTGPPLQKPVLPDPLCTSIQMPMRLVRRPAAVRPGWDVDLLVWAGGNPEAVGEALAGTLERLRAELPEACVTFLVDGREWERWLRPWRRRFPSRREIVLPEPTDLPQILYARGLARSPHPWAPCLWPGRGGNGGGPRRLRAAPAVYLV